MEIESQEVNTQPPSSADSAEDKGKTTSQGSKGVALDSILAAVIPTLGLSIYVILRGTYVSLYSRFGITPEDVGIDYFAVLTGAARIFRLGNWEPGENPAIGSLCALAILTAIFLVLRMIRAQASKRAQVNNLSRFLGQRFGFFLIYLAVVLALAAAAIGMFLEWIELGP
jgi:hypothetical protein